MNPKLAIVVVVTIGGALRFWHIDAGLPYRIGPDEPVIAERAIHMMRTGEFHPRFYDYPGLYIYLQLLVGCMRFVTGAMSGLWLSVKEFYPEHLFLWTRLVNAALGTLTLALLYRAGARWGQWVGVAAAAMLAFWPNHVRESHFALTDVPLTFLIVVTLLGTLRAYESGRLTWFAAAGAAVGLSAATKYNGGIALVIPLAAAAVVHLPAARRLTAAGLVVIASGVAFLAAAPYTVLDLPGFLNAFGQLSTFYRPRPFQDGAHVYFEHAQFAAGTAALLLAAAGILWSAVRALRDHTMGRWLILVVFPLVYFQSIATKHLIFGRYLLPMLPFLCLFMAIALVDVVNALWTLRKPMWVRSAAITAIAGITLFPLARNGIAWPAEHGRHGTLDVAYEQILEVIPKGAGVAVERSALRLPDTLYKKRDVDTLLVHAPQEYIARGTTYVVASSDVFGRFMERPSAHAAEYQGYQAIFNPPGHCLPTIQPTNALPGPQIIICRLDAPIR